MQTILEQEIAKIPERVARGVDAMVAEHGLKFFDMIDLDTLDIAYTRMCILGQTYSGFCNAPEIYIENDTEYGFEETKIINCKNEGIYLKSLTKHWKQEITKWRERLKELSEDEALKIFTSENKELLRVEDNV